MQNEQELIAYVGTKSKHFLKKWHKSRHPEKAISWNWAAFLLSPFWFAYRRMVKWAGILTAAFFLSALFFPGLMFLILIFAGLYGNALYYRSASEMIQKSHELEPDFERRLELLRAAGGVHTQTLIFFIGISLLLALFETLFIR